MTMTAWTRPALLAVAGLCVVTLGRFYAKPVMAQVRAALVQSVDEPGRNAFVLSTNSSNGAAFFPVPAGKRYVVEQYSAACTVASTTYLSDLTMYTSVGIANHQSHVVPALQQRLANIYAATGQGPAYADGNGIFFPPLPPRTCRGM